MLGWMVPRWLQLWAKALNQDIFLEGPTSSAPVLFHDFAGENWKDHVRRRLAPHLAAILENAAYTATFALFLLADGDAAREGALQELGITATDVENIRSQLGAVTSGDRDRHDRWFSAVLSVRTGLQADRESRSGSVACAIYATVGSQTKTQIG